MIEESKGDGPYSNCSWADGLLTVWPEGEKKREKKERTAQPAKSIALAFGLTNPWRINGQESGSETKGVEFKRLRDESHICVWRQPLRIDGPLVAQEMPSRLKFALCPSRVEESFLLFSSR